MNRNFAGYELPSMWYKCPEIGHIVGLLTNADRFFAPLAGSGEALSLTLLLLTLLVLIAPGAGG